MQKSPIAAFQANDIGFINSLNQHQTQSKELTNKTTIHIFSSNTEHCFLVN